MLVKKLSKHGNSLALVIDKPILELLGIDENTRLQIRTDGRELIIIPLVDDEQRRRRFEEAMAFTFDQHGEALAELAKEEQKSPETT